MVVELYGDAEATITMLRDIVAGREKYLEMQREGEMESGAMMMLYARACTKSRKLLSAGGRWRSNGEKKTQGPRNKINSRRRRERCLCRGGGGGGELNVHISF